MPGSTLNDEDIKKAIAILKSLSAPPKLTVDPTLLAHKMSGGYLSHESPLKKNCKQCKGLRKFEVEIREDMNSLSKIKRETCRACGESTETNIAYELF